MKNVLNILRILILSGILVTGLSFDAAAQSGLENMLNSIESEKKQADTDFEALKKQHPELGLNDKDKEWYTNDRAYRELLHKDLSSKNLEQLRQQGLQYEKNIQTKNFQAGISFSTTPKEETPKEKLLRETEESRQQNSTRIEELNQKIANGSITLDERFELNTLENPHAVALSEIDKQEQLLQFNKGETIDMVANRKGGGNNSVEICSKSCSPYCYYKDLDRCTFCRLFETFFNTASSMAKKAMNTFAGSVVQVVIIAFAIWLAILVLGFISSIETRDVKDLVSSILQQGFMVALVVILLQTGGASFFNLVLSPIYTTGMKIAQTALTPNIKDIKTDGKTLVVTQGNNSDQVTALLSQYQKTPVSEQQKTSYEVRCDKGNIYGLDRGALPKEMGESILCTMTMIQNQASKIKALGSSAICYSWEKRVLIFPHLSYLLTGIGLWIGGMILIIAVPFLMIDAVLELAVAAALLPAAIGAYAFKITRRYSKPVWDTFLNSMFVFMFVSLIALMLTTAFEMVLIDTTKGNLDTLIFAPNSELSFEEMLKDIGWFSVAFLKICFALILTWTVMGEAKDFAGQFSGSISNTAIGSQIGTMAGSFTKSAVKKVGSPLAEAAGDHLWRDGGNLLRSPIHAINRARMNRRNNRVVQQGEKIGDNTYKLGNRTVRVDQNGNKTLLSTKEKTVRSGWGKKLGTVTSTKIQNKHFSVETQSGVLDDGTTYQRDIVKLNSNAMRKLYNRRGQINQELYNELLESCGDNKKLKIALMKQIIHHNMPNMKHKVTDHQYVSQEPILDDNGEVIGYTEYLPDGSKVEVKISTNDQGRMLSEVTQVDAKGQGMKLSTDGIINRKEGFLTKDGTVDGEKDKDSIKVRYGAAAYYNNIRMTGRFKREAMKEGMMGEETENALNSIKYRDDGRGTGMYEFRTNTF